MKKLIIKKSFYYSCGRNYGWKNDGYTEIGVGIAKDWFIKNKEFIVNVDKQDYLVESDRAMDFINKYKSYENIRGIRIGYLTKDLLKKL